MASGIDTHVMSVRQLHGLHQLHQVQVQQHDEMVANTKAMHSDMARFHNSYPGVASDGASEFAQQDQLPKLSIGNQVAPPLVAQPLESELRGLIAKLKEEMTVRQQALGAEAKLVQTLGSNHDEKMGSQGVRASDTRPGFLSSLLGDGSHSTPQESREELVRKQAEEAGRKEREAALEQRLVSSEAQAEALQKQLVQLQSHQNRTREDSSKLSMGIEGYKRQVAALEQRVAAQDKREAELLSQVVSHRESALSKHDDHAELEKQIDQHKAAEDHLRKVLVIQEMELRELRQAGAKSKSGTSGGIMDFITCGGEREKAGPRPMLSPADPYPIGPLGDSASRESSRGYPPISNLDLSGFRGSPPPRLTPNSQYDV
jgi:hypothetical protein